ncbi:hypothetical protein Glove_136g72 [Diversispora epigaea]|uniref:Uncharacterized protein n=1 Tax=Diversispora epigaea TaxID=1348612 RepID=A0A397J0K5_9GLOM|nr:hypothetical protein Glove_136g72 [Diversispora epigaea]
MPAFEQYLKRKIAINDKEAFDQWSTDMKQDARFAASVFEILYPKPKWIKLFSIMEAIIIIQN